MNIIILVNNKGPTARVNDIIASSPPKPLLEEGDENFGFSDLGGGGSRLSAKIDVFQFRGIRNFQGGMKTLMNL